VNEDEFAVQKERVRNEFNRWRNVLGLDEWHIDLRYRDGEFIKGDGSPSADAVGLTRVDWEYRRAAIDFRCDMIADLDAAELEYVVVHEGMHVLLNGQRAIRDLSEVGAAHREYERLFEEHTATTLARAFINARRAGDV
jgi:hypothetical protein